MSIVFNQKYNHKAIILSNVYATVEESIAGLQLIDFKNRYSIYVDPISQHHTIIENETRSGLAFRLDNNDIAIANQNRHMLYHLLATVLNHFDEQTKVAS